MSYSRKETVVGWVVPEGGLIRVAVRQPGLIDQLAVAEGQRVGLGQPVAQLRLSSDSAQGDVGVAMRRDLAAELAATKAGADAARARLVYQKQALVGRSAALGAEMREIQRSIDIQVKRNEIAERQLARGETLRATGYLTISDLDLMKANALAAARDLSTTRASLLGYQRQQGDIDRELASITAEFAATKAQGDQALAMLSQKENSVEAQSDLSIRSPIDGSVVALPVERGQTLAAGSTVAILAPANAKLIAELYVPSRSAGFLHQGLDVRLMYQAFPYQRFGTGSGKVVSVSKTVFAPSDIAIPGLSLQEPMFRIRVSIDRDTVLAYGRREKLQPGMLLNADVVIDKRTLAQWILDPLYAAGRRA